MGKDPTTSARKRQIVSNRMRRRQRQVQREIDTLQRSPGNVVPYVSFSRVVREILATHGAKNMRSDAMRALQCATEGRMTEMFSDALRLATYQKRDTVVHTDIQFVIPPDERPAVVEDTSASTLFPLPEPVQSPGK